VSRAVGPHTHQQLPLQLRRGVWYSHHPAASNGPNTNDRGRDMDRRQFLKNAALIAAGAIAGDQLSLLERLGWKRRFFPSAQLYRVTKYYETGFVISSEIVEDDLYGSRRHLSRSYLEAAVAKGILIPTPFANPKSWALDQLP
jgi:hypothetical protein